jgi:L-threonylcarbamoyladenylate synthase
MITRGDAAAFERCIREGGVAVFPADTVYGVACDPDSAAAIERMYSLKGRAPDKPSAVMFFRLESALGALRELGEQTELALRRLLPGPMTAVVPNPSGAFALAARGDSLGIRVPRLEGVLEPLAAAGVAVLQTSANFTGQPDARRVEDVPEPIREGAELVLDGGELAGSPSTVGDLTEYERTGRWEVLREAAVSRAQVKEMLKT